MGYLSFTFAFPSMIAGPEKGLSAERQLALRAAGGPIASGRIGARIGQVFLSRPLVRIEVFRTGLVLKPVFMAPRVVLASEIQAVRYRAGWTVRGIEIVHAGTEVRSPIGLAVQEHDPVARAIRGLQSRESPSIPADMERQPQRQAPSSLGLPAGIELGVQVLGLVVGAILVMIGILWLIPEAGIFGWIWTGVVLAIGVINARRWLRR
jgi:hypothetical protein